MFSLRCGQSDIVVTVDCRCHWHRRLIYRWHCWHRGQIIAGVVDTSEKFAGGITGNWCKSLVPTTSVVILPQVLLTSAEDLSLRISSWIFEKFKCRYGNLPGPGEYYSWKPEVKNHVTLSLYALWLESWSRTVFPGTLYIFCTKLLINDPQINFRQKYISTKSELKKFLSNCYYRFYLV